MSQTVPPGKHFLNWLETTYLGTFITFLGSTFGLLTQTVRCLFRNPPTWTSIVHELNKVGVRSIMIVAVTALAVGLVMAVQFGFGLARFGAKLYVPKVLAISVVRELGPIFTALMMAGRVGAGITAEIGAMKVTSQIDAIRALSTDPIEKLIAPKIIACVVAAPLLTIMANLIAIFGGLVISMSELNLSAFDFFFKSFEIITTRDVMGGIYKSIAFGLIVGIVGCYYGLTTSDGTQGVGSNTTKAVVTGSITIVFFDFVLTKALWILETMVKTGSL